MAVVISWRPNSKATFTAAVFIMDEENGVLLQTVRLLQRKLDKYSGLNDEKKVLFYLGRLRKSDMTVDILRDTGVGRTVNFVRINKSGPMAEEARKLVDVWKQLVASADGSDEEEEENVEEVNDREEAADAPTGEESDREEERVVVKENGRVQHQDHQRNPQRRKRNRDPDHRAVTSASEAGSDVESVIPASSSSGGHRRKRPRSSSSEKDDTPLEIQEEGSSSPIYRLPAKRITPPPLPPSPPPEPPKERRKGSSEGSSSSRKKSRSDKSERREKHRHSESSPSSSHGRRHDCREDGPPPPASPAAVSSSSRKKKKKKKERDRDRSPKRPKEEKRKEDSAHSSPPTHASSAAVSFEQALMGGESKKGHKKRSKHAGAESSSSSTPSPPKSKKDRQSKPLPPDPPLTNHKPSSKPRTNDAADSSDSDDFSFATAKPSALIPDPTPTPTPSNVTSGGPTVPPLRLTLNYTPSTVSRVLVASLDPALQKKKPHKSEEEALMTVLSNKVSRTKVYSGKKTAAIGGEVPSLFEICTAFLQENLDSLEYTGGIPYHVLERALERATPTQLFTLEDNNQYLIGDTEPLWERHVKRDFPREQREEFESYREMYVRCHETREKKLQMLTENIKNKHMEKSKTVTTTKLAYVDVPRAKQSKFALTSNSSLSDISRRGITKKFPPSSHMSNGDAHASSGAMENPVPVPNTGGGRERKGLTDPTSTGHSGSSSSARSKPKTAPLMKKALMAFKNQKRR